MNPRRIDGATMVLGAPADWHDTHDGRCMGLPVRVIDCQNSLYLVSAWEPTPAELEALNRGETVKLWIMGTSHPVVSLSVGDIE